jgi:hypothetical protein
MNVKNRIRRIALREDNLIFSINGYGLSFASLREKGADVEPACNIFFQVWRDRTSLVL